MPNYFVSTILTFLKNNPVWPVVTLVTIVITNPVEMIVSSKLTEKFIASVKEKPNMRYLWWIIAMTLASNMTHSLQEVIEAHYITKLQQEIRMDLLSKISTKQEFNYETMDGGDTITNVKNIPSNVSNFVDRFTSWVVTPVINVTLIGAYLVRINAPLGLKIMGILIAFMACNFAVLRSVPQEAQSQEVEEATLINQIDDALNNTLSTMMCDYTNQEMAAIDTQHVRFNAFMANNLQKRAYGTILTGITIVIALALIVWLIFQSYHTNVVSKANMIVMLLVSISLVRMIRHYSSHMVQAFLEYAKLVKHDTFIQGLAHKTVPDGVETGAIHGTIVFKRVSYSYEGTDRKSLDDVSFKLRAKDRVAIVGSSGSGKTTILKLIMGFSAPSAGAVLIDGHNVRDMRRNTCASTFRWCPKTSSCSTGPSWTTFATGRPTWTPSG